MRARLAIPDDAAAIAAIYNQGIEERSATFETTLRSDEDILEWFDGAHPVVVVLDDAGDVIAFARAGAYSARECYRGVFDFAVYTDFTRRRQGAGMLAMRELVTQARTAGAWKLTSRIFVDNNASRMMVASLGFREVGIHHRHAKLDGKWRDVAVVEKFLAPVGGEASIPPPPARAPRDQVIASLRSNAPSSRTQALDSARSLLEVYRRPDSALLAAVTDACFGSRSHDPDTRRRFVELFRAYAALSREASAEVLDAIFERMGRIDLAADVDAFYEASFVVKQVTGAAGEGPRMLDLARRRAELVSWLEQAVALPRTTRSRISPGNLASLLATLALLASDSEEQKNEVTALVAAGRERHRLELPTSARPPPLPSPRPPAVTIPSSLPPSLPPPTLISPAAQTAPPALAATAAEIAPESLVAAAAPEATARPKPKKRASREKKTKKKTAK